MLLVKIIWESQRVLFSLLPLESIKLIPWPLFPITIVSLCSYSNNHMLRVVAASLRPSACVSLRVTHLRAMTGGPAQTDRKPCAFHSTLLIYLTTDSEAQRVCLGAKKFGSLKNPKPFEPLVLWPLTSKSPPSSSAPPISNMTHRLALCPQFVISLKSIEEKSPRLVFFPLKEKKVLQLWPRDGPTC